MTGVSLCSIVIKNINVVVHNTQQSTKSDFINCLHERKIRECSFSSSVTSFLHLKKGWSLPLVDWPTEREVRRQTVLSTNFPTDCRHNKARHISAGALL